MQAHNRVKTKDKMLNSELIQLAKEYTCLLQEGKDDQAVNLFSDMCKINNMGQVIPESYLYDEVGKLTRELHDNINQFVNESQMQAAADEEMPDARQRLEYVVELTDRSAHKTMSLIENSLPVVASLDKKVVEIKKEIDGKIHDEVLYQKITKFLDFSSSVSVKVAEDLNGIMLAQDYQDLTGQIIQRVSVLVQSVENNLIELLKITDCNNSEVSTDNEKQELKENSNGFGPVVPGVNHGEVLQSQDEVDDLLSSLGF